jgi:predicted membrane-bound spermidine synthase
MSWRLNIAVFIAGAVVMAFEMTGSRVMAPAVGTSLVAWTALIGVVLASLSFGYWWGGRVADRYPEPRRLAMLLAWAALAIGFTSLFYWPLVGSIATTTWDIRIVAVIGSLILFAPAAALLGTVSPFAAKLSIRDLATDGRTIGTLYALSTAGSIAGTFVGGFVLIPALGTTASLGVLAGLTVCAALLVGVGRRGIIVTAVALMTGGAAWATGYLPGIIDTPYQRLLVFENIDEPSGRMVRYLATDIRTAQAAVFLDGDGLVFPYTRFFRHGEELLARPPTKALAIGGAVYTWPRDFITRNPDARITVAEIDPGMTDVARQFFGLTNEARMDIVHEDGRVFLNRTSEQYDLVYLDAFSGLTIPFQLVTREAAQRLRGALVPDGVLMINVIGSLEGEASELVRSVYTTFASVFPSVRVFPVTHPDQSEKVQNIILVAGTGELALAGTPAYTNVRPGMLLTDDHAPVDLFSLALLRNR